MVAKKTRYTYLLYAILIFWASWSLLPIIYMVVTAFKPLNEILTYPPRFWVEKPTLDGFRQLGEVLENSSTPVTRYIFNSVFVTFTTVVFTIFFATLAAYPLAKHRFWGKELFFFIIICGLMISPHVTLIPRYMVLRNIGWLNTYRALILPAVASAYSLFLMKQFVEPIPDELIESAKMDGASEFRVLWHVIMPLCRPAWCTLAIFLFIWSWNDFTSPIVFMESDQMMTLPVAMSRIAYFSIDRLQAASAAAFLTILPVILVFILLQRYVIETMVYSGLKG